MFSQDQAEKNRYTTKFIQNYLNKFKDDVEKEPVLVPTIVLGNKYDLFE